MLRLHRTDYLSRGTRGVLFLPSGKSLHTIELPWRENRQGDSCIPEGTYPVGQRPFYAGGGYKTAHIKDVPDRSLILVHIGNTIADLDGCVAVGLSQGEFAPEGYDEPVPAVLNSTEAFEKHFWPEVREAIPTEIEIGSAEKVHPASMERFGTLNLQEHASELAV